MSSKYKSKGKNYRSKDYNKEKDNSTLFFPTYHSLTRLYLPEIDIHKKDSILEPCAGAGDITKVLREFGYNNITQCDINPQKDDIIKQDFIKDYSEKDKVDHIITNPPFKLSMEFMQKASKVATRSISFLWPLDYLHGVERFEKIYEIGINGFFLKTCYVFVRRPLFDKKYHPAGPMPTGATSFAWFYFVHGNGWLVSLPAIKWIHNNAEMGVPWEAEQHTFEFVYIE